ncbi:MAG: glycosyltransferase, partial [Gemmatimonadales bacterium]
PLAWVVVALTAAVLLFILPFGLHRTALLRARFRRPPVDPRPADPDTAPSAGPHPTRTDPAAAALDLPHVTVQLPLYNEPAVAARLVEAAGRLRHPDHLLEIQVLDDSTDHTPTRVAEALARVAAHRDCRLVHLRREDRAGYKAGALARGVEEARGDLFLVLDADFVPPPDLLERLLPALDAPGTGVVQARWDHLNEGERLLTRGQARILDGHFLLEQESRHRAGHFLNFNGTAGIWRREALEAAGGWSSDTLTEDMDASYRAQLAGWRFVFLADVGVPAELPSTVRAFEVQQQRWAQGAIQTARKLLPAVWRAPLRLSTRLEATAHLTGHLAHALTLLLGLLLLPSALARQTLGLERVLLLDLPVFVLATLSFTAFYAAAGGMRGRSLPRSVAEALLALGMGVGLTASVTPAVLRGLRPGNREPFRRTPKRGSAVGPLPMEPGGTGIRRFRLVLVLWALLSLAGAVWWGFWASIPFLLLFLLGWGGLAVADAVDGVRGRRGPAAGSPSPAPPRSGRIEGGHALPSA